MKRRWSNPTALQDSKGWTCACFRRRTGAGWSSAVVTNVRCDIRRLRLQQEPSGLRTRSASPWTSICDCRGFIPPLRRPMRAIWRHGDVLPNFKCTWSADFSRPRPQEINHDRCSVRSSPSNFVCHACRHASIASRSSKSSPAPPNLGWAHAPPLRALRLSAPRWVAWVRRSQNAQSLRVAVVAAGGNSNFARNALRTKMTRVFLSGAIAGATNTHCTSLGSRSHHYWIWDFFLSQCHDSGKELPSMPHHWSTSQAVDHFASVAVESKLRTSKQLPHESRKTRTPTMTQSFFDPAATEPQWTWHQDVLTRWYLHTWYARVSVCVCVFVCLSCCCGLRFTVRSSAVFGSSMKVFCTHK